MDLTLTTTRCVICKHIQHRMIWPDQVLTCAVCGTDAYPIIVVSAPRPVNA